MTEPVVGCALIRVHQNIVSLAKLFKFLFGLLVVRVFVGMKFDGELAISAFHLLAGRTAVDFEDFVIIALFRGHVTLRTYRNYKLRASKRPADYFGGPDDTTTVDGRSNRSFKR